MMPRNHPDIPTSFESRRLHLRSYCPGDGPCYYAVGLRNREHLLRYESDNIVMQLRSEQDAEDTVRELAELWEKRKSFFIGGFDKSNQQFVVQVYVGLINGDLPEYQIGFFVDRGYEGQSYVTEAVRATLEFIFHYLEAHRVSAECDETNTRSIRVLERCGMVREGSLRENRRNADGSISGTLHYGLLKQEFDDLHRQMTM
nr:GNAT family N-acetyltransferase [candidate division Zixibacteria bacterium]